MAFNLNRSLGLAWILIFRRVDFVWFLMSDSELLRIKNDKNTLNTKGSSDIWSDVNRRLFETIATISRVQLFLSQ